MIPTAFAEETEAADSTIPTEEILTEETAPPAEETDTQVYGLEFVGAFGFLVVCYRPPSPGWLSLTLYLYYILSTL